MVLLVLVGGLAAVKGAQIGSLIKFGEEMEKAGMPPETVSTAEAKAERWAGSIDAVGSVAAAKGVQLSSDASGRVTAIRFDSGAKVKAGQVLVELDSNVERSQLASARSRLELAESTAKRSRTLADKGALTQAELERDESQAKTAKTEIATLEAQIALKVVRAPFAGKLGIRQVNLGQYLSPGTPITVLEGTEAVHVDFTLPQQRLPDLKVGQPVQITLSSDQGEAAGPTADAGPAESIAGSISAIDPTVDTATRTIKLRATAAGADDRLRPGMFVRVEVALAEQNDVVTVPMTAVLRAPYGNSVFLVEPAEGDKPKPVRQQFVRLGTSRGDFVAIAQGLQAGQTVVRAGAFKLRPGSTVVVDNNMGPTPEQDPHPANR